MIIFIILFILAIFALVLYLQHRNFHKVVKMFEYEGVSVYGKRGRGKDLLTANVVVERDLPYVSNIPYTKDEKNFIKFDPEYMSLGGNTFHGFARGEIIQYDYPLPDKADFYISDVGVHYPAQYNDVLNRLYPSVPMFLALCRHLGDCAVHFNSQSLSRPWDKLREQNECYVYCKSCKVLFGKFVFQSIIVYDRYQSALDKVSPLNLKTPLLGKKVKNDIAMTKAKYLASYGNIKPMRLFYKNKSCYDSRRFKTILSQGHF